MSDTEPWVVRHPGGTIISKANGMAVGTVGPFTIRMTQSWDGVDVEVVDGFEPVWTDIDDRVMEAIIMPMPSSAPKAGPISVELSARSAAGELDRKTRRKRP